MAKDVQTARFERAHKGRRLFEAGSYVETPDGLLVFSETGVGCYLVTEEAGCSCPDKTVGFSARAGIKCGHEELAAILARRAQPAPRRLPPREEWDR